MLTERAQELQAENSENSDPVCAARVGGIGKNSRHASSPPRTGLALHGHPLDLLVGPRARRGTPNHERTSPVNALSWTRRVFLLLLRRSEVARLFGSDVLADEFSQVCLTQRDDAVETLLF